MYRTKYKPLISSEQITPLPKNQLPTQLTKSKELMPNLYHQSGSQEHNSQHQCAFSHPQKDNSLSQNASSKRESPIKIQYSLMQSCPSGKPYSSCLSEVGHVKQILTIQGNNKEEQIIKCQHNDTQSDQSCQICRGRGFLEQNDNLVKFFKYLIDFKLGKKPSYSLKKQVITEVESVRSDFYKQPTKLIPKKCCNKNFTYRLNQRKSQRPVVNDRLSNVNIKRVNESVNNPSTRYSTKSATCYRKQEVIQEFNNAIVVHENYKCDQCMCDPIIGVRFHCHTCGDFDLCQKCNREFPHMHLMQKIEKSGKNKQIQNMLSFLASPTNLSSSLRSPQIKRQNYLTVTRSAVA